jgi:hypothetical protein
LPARHRCQCAAPFDREGVVVIGAVPPEVRPRRGEVYSDGSTARELLALARRARQAGGEVEVRDFGLEFGP